MRILGTGRYQVAMLAAALVVGLVGEAGAWSHGSWGSYGSAGSWGYSSYGSSGSYGSYGSGGSYGSYGRIGILGRIHMRHAARHSYGSYGSYGSSASYGSYASVSYGSSGSCGSSGGYSSYGSSGSYGGASYGTPVETPTTEPAPETTSSAVIEVTVPADAKVFVNNKETTSTGNTRSYVSNNLQAGKTYLYNFRVEFSQDGKTVVKNESVKLSAGDRVALSFGTNKEPQHISAADTRTELKLTVPENAKVFLAGSPTDQTGSVRTYVTHRLSAGQTWAGYTVRVEAEVNGKTEVREEKLAIVGGKSFELAFDFENSADQLAAK